MNRANWQLPPGVSRESWDYIQSEKIASQYEDFLQNSALFELDLNLVKEHVEALEFENSSAAVAMADLGSGTGRISRSLAGPNRYFLNIDLSGHMLTQCQSLLPAEAHACPIRGNLAELQFLRPDSLDLAVCLFSSLGMIRPREQRVQLLREVYGALRPSGRFLVHVHNRYQSLREWAGRKWLASSWLQSWLGTSEYGDRIYPYRGLPRMFLHIYSKRELCQDFNRAGFKRIKILPIHCTGEHLLPENLWCSGLRAGGFFAIAQK